MDRKYQIYFVLLTVVIDAMGIGIIMPVTPDLIRDLLDTDLANAAIWGGILSSSFAVMQFLFGAAIGNLSDRFGRRPVLLTSLLVIGVDYIVMGLTNSIWILLLGRIIGGIASATHSTASAFMADISRPEEKSQNFGLIGAAFGIGFVLGPMLGGLLSQFGPRAPFFAAAALAFANLAFGYFVMPETLSAEKRRGLEWQRINPFGALKYVGSLPGLGPLLIIFFVHQLAFMVYPTVWAYYTQERFDWSALQVGLSLMMFGAGMAAVQGGLMRVLVPRFGDWRLLGGGMAISSFALLVFSLVNQGWMVYALIPLTALGLVSGPALSGISSRAVPDNAQGELQGVLAAVGAIGTIISPLMMTGLFGYFASDRAPIYLPGAPFMVAALLELAALVIFLLALGHMRKRT